MRHGGGRFAVLLQQMECGNPGAVSADAGVIENGGARPGRQHQMTGVKTAVGARHHDPAGRIARKRRDGWGKYMIHWSFLRLP